jgi:hypothetical protein
VTLYGTTGSIAATGGGSLYTLTDTSGYNSTITGTFTTIATAMTNEAFRGVAFVRTPEPGTWLLAGIAAFAGLGSQVWLEVPGCAAVCTDDLRD